MVKVKDNPHILPDGSIDTELWLQELSNKGYFQELETIRAACTLSQLVGAHQPTETGQSSFQQGLSAAEILADLAVDTETLIAAILYESSHAAELSLEIIEEQFGATVAKLVQGVEKMAALSNMEALGKYPTSRHQLDNIRKMLLAMVDDVRVVLIKLAERLSILRSAAPIPIALRQQIATQVMDIYAPLANRLGIGALKWEMEDLAFRYLCPEEYKSIAKGLNSKRLERDEFVKQIIHTLNDAIKEEGIQHFAVYGRSKHIHSIYRKMQRKNVALNEIYDATAVRILVDTEEQCYQVLSLVHTLWEQVVAEFDDYIVNPKDNGYQSLHTAVKSQQGRIFEVQIRTFIMHEQAEMGVAAHWKYKEGHIASKESHERKIEWLREVLAWHQEIANNQGITSSIEHEFLDDRVYVFTPDGDVLDLPKGVTPLDFAYHVHSEVGHRCRGAKVNDHIVPLTYTLKTGDKVEILTGKHIKPSRDWINPHLNYLHTSRAKAKVLHWFKMQDFDKHVADGHELVDRELKNLGIKNERMYDVVTAFNLKSLDELYAALGRGDIKPTQVLARLSPVDSSAKDEPILIKTSPKTAVKGDDLRIEGVGHLLTHMARCCQPVPGDEVIGYITLGRGVSVHRQDCTNILHANEKQRQRFLQVTWGQAAKERYSVNIIIRAYDRTDLLRDITSLLANEKAHIQALQTQNNKKEHLSHITLTIEIDGLTTLSRLLHRLAQLPNVLEAKRQAV